MDARGLRRACVAVSVVLLVGVTMSSVAGVARAGDVTRRERLFRLTNEARVEHGLQRLTLVDRLSRYAKRHSRAMADRGYVFHSDTSALRRALRRYNWSVAGENVGVGDSVDSVQTAFMASGAHRKNILRPAFDHTGIGMVRRSGSLWVTVIFYG